MHNTCSSHSHILQALQKFSDDVVPLTVYQIHTIVSVAPVNEKGIIKYALMVPIVERTVRAITDLQHMKTRFYVIEQLAQSDLLTDLSKADPEKFRVMLREAFERADINKSGTLTGVTTDQLMLPLLCTIATIGITGACMDTMCQERADLWHRLSPTVKYRP